MPGCKALKEAQERHWMQTALYVDSAENLDITIPGTPYNNQVISPNIIYTLLNNEDVNLITVVHEQLPGVILDMYLNQSPNFRNETHCEALETSLRANRLCEQLGGETILSTQEGYNIYVIEGNGEGEF